MPRGKKTNASYWLPILEAWKKSDVSKKEFCLKESLNYKNFTKWYGRLMIQSKTVAIKKTDLFMPVKIKSAEPLNLLPSTKPLVLVLNKQAQLHIPIEHVNEQLLMIIFRPLGVLSC